MRIQQYKLWPAAHVLYVDQFYDMQEVRYDEIGPWTCGSWMGLETEHTCLLKHAYSPPPKKKKKFSKLPMD